MKVMIVILLLLVLNKAYAMTGYQQEVVAAGLILEATSDGQEGMEAVMSVIVNRARVAGKTPLQILTRPGQFSAMASVWNKKKPNFSPLIAKAKKDENWKVALSIVHTYEGGLWIDTSCGSTYYHTVDISPSWSRSKDLRYAGTVGAHRFYAPVSETYGANLY
jgi:spore germination cell wall hydrolase CwlJ-like protein